MAPLVVPNTIQARILWNHNATPWAINVLHLIAGPGMTVGQDEADDWYDIVAAAFSSSGLRARISDSWQLAGAGLRDVRAANLSEYTKMASLAGTDTSAGMLPPQLALVVTLRTLKAGRSFRGRVYLAGFTEGQNTGGGQIDANCMTAADAFVTALGAPTLNGSETTLGVCSRTLLETNPVTSIVVRDAQWDVQRRRKDGIPDF